MASISTMRLWFVSKLKDQITLISIIYELSDSNWNDLVAEIISKYEFEICTNYIF